MKILAVRGRNLASLGEFSVDFENGPLAEAGLFAITGPTGSGKTTLLDALCLALYDRTPRLAAKRSVLVGHAASAEEDRLRAADPRTVLRHGAADGFAEVDFAGADGIAYRARWSVRRARGAREGRLQKQTLSLVERETGRAIAGKKTEVLAAIESRLGLSFDQFRRSVLLAQGDFAAFLRADEKERAELLERMTGTELYGQISMAAHRRAEKERETCNAVHACIDQSPILTAEERDRLVAETADTRQRLAGNKNRLGVLRSAVDFWSRRDELDAAERHARELLGAACERLELQRPAAMDVDAAAEAGAALSTLGRLKARRLDVDRMTTESRVTAVHLAACEKRQVDAQATLATSASRVEEARTKRRDAEPALWSASELDRELAVAVAGAAERKRELEQAAGLATRLARQHTWMSGAWSQLQEAEGAEHRDAEDRLGDAEALDSMAQLWPRWSQQLRSLAQVRERASALAGRIAERETELAAAAKQMETLAAELSEGESKLADAAARREAAVAASDAVPVAEARAEVDGLRDETDATRKLSDITTGCARLIERREIAASARDAGAAVVEGVRRARPALEERREKLAASRAEADAGCRALRRASDLVAERARLAAGDACPLCGSTEHPWAENRVVDALFAEKQKELLELSSQMDQLITELARTDAAAKAGESDGVRAESELAECKRGLAGFRDAWATALGEAGQFADLEDPAVESTRTWLGRRLEHLAVARKKAEQCERQAQALAQQVIDATQLAETRRSDLDQCRHRHGQASAGWAEAERIILIGREQKRALDGEARHLWAAITAAAQQRLAELGETLQSSRADVGEARERADKTAGDCRQLSEKRQAHFNGQPVDEVRHTLDDAILEAEAQGRVASANMDECRKAFLSATKAAEAALARFTTARVEVSEAESVLAAELEKGGIDQAELRRLSELDPAWLETATRSVAANRAEVARLTAVIAERKADRSRHESSSSHSLQLDRGEAVAALAATEAEGEALVAAVAESVAALHRDDAARKTRAALSNQLEQAATRAETYAALAELIGSADGKKFRVFAQSLTLEMLLIHANCHLEEFAPRYALARVPGHDLEIQIVDRDMGDEIRSVNSLSGGESFLVSLALALALSSLSAQDTQIESLLIDEGFGTLDPVTLDVALSVLDALQNAGRKVGLISHVPGLAERVGVRVEVQPRGGGLSDVRVVV